MKIDISNSQKKINPDFEGIRHFASKILKFFGETKVELSIYFVDDADIRRLNYRYRNIDKPTDVLAFSMREGRKMKGADGVLGDVVISTDAAARAARLCPKRIKDEIDLYLLHGILHLLGYDENTIRNRRKMKKMQDYILAFFKAKRNE